MIILFHYLSKVVTDYLGIRKDKNAQHLPRIRFRPYLYCQRYIAVVKTLVEEKWRKQMRRLVDFGCAECEIFVYLSRITLANSITLVDVDEEILNRGVNRVNAPREDRPQLRQQPLEVNVFSGSVADPDYRLLSTDAVTAVELIEHLYPDVLEAFPYNVFGFIKPKVAIVTTPNADFNVLFLDMPDKFRHDDHKFEWTREQFQEWALNITARFPDYTVSFSGVGTGPRGTEHLGHCTQIATFVRAELLDDYYVPAAVPRCRCHDESLCKDPKLRSKLAEICRCICPSCCPSASYGICKYRTLSNRIVYRDMVDDDENITSGKAYYKLMRNEMHPFNDDGRSEDEMLLDELLKRLRSLGEPDRTNFFKTEDQVCEIPLGLVVDPKDGVCISESEAIKILATDGISVVNRPIDEPDITKTEKYALYYPYPLSLSPYETEYNSDSDYGSESKAKYRDHVDWDAECAEDAENEPQPITELLPEYVPSGLESPRLIT